MSLPIIDGFDNRSNNPIDVNYIVANVAALAGLRFVHKGMWRWVTDVESVYILQNDLVTWKPVNFGKGVTPWVAGTYLLYDLVIYEGALFESQEDANTSIPNTDANWLKILGQKGDKGDTGSTGRSAYQVWLANGNTGTVTDYLNSLKGEGIPTGGAAGQILSKVNSVDYNTEWVYAPVIDDAATSLTKVYSSQKTTDLLDDKVDKVSGKSLIDDSEISRLAGISNLFDGTYTTLAALQAAHPTSAEGHTAIVDAGSGSDAITYIWDLQDGWVQGGGTGASTFATISGSPTDNSALSAALSSKEPAVTAGTTAQYYRGDKSWSTLLTDVMALVLTGLSFGTVSAIVATDTILAAFGKLQAQINAIVVPVKNSATELNTGTDDAKFTTALGLQNSKYVDQSGAKVSATASGTNTYTASISPAIAAYVNGQVFYIKFTNANTAAATLNLNSLGAKSIVKNGSTALASNDIVSGQIICVSYDGTNFQIANPLSGVLPTVTTGEKAITITSAGAQKNYDVYDQTVSATPLTAADFSTGIAAVTGVTGQVAYDNDYRYDCVGTNQWRRSAMNGQLIDLYLADISDTGGDKTSAQLETAYPGSLPGQWVWGDNNLYIKKTSSGWKKIAATNA